MSENKIIKSVNEYYTEKVKTHGASPNGVDWNNAESQDFRFKILLQVVSEPMKHFSVIDYGCGYGAMYGYMKKNFPDFFYSGYDISESMLSEAKKIYNADTAIWNLNEAHLKPSDYVISSGIFNVRLDNSEKEWKEYIIETIHKMNNLAVKGLSLNLLTSYSDKTHMRDNLYYADPAFFFDYCKRNISKYVALLHNYPLYEFTLLINKTDK